MGPAMTSGVASFEAVFVISDLHLGDDPARSMFQDDARLGQFIDHVASQRPNERVALVLNGDIVDLLAGPHGRRFDPEGAASKVDEIARNFPSVFAALRRFTATTRRTLVLALGNHDVELRLPAVTETLLRALCADESHRGRVRLCLDGAGLRCLVGGRTVFIVHGNDSDDWNTVDHERLRETAAAQNMGAALPSWTTNAGTTLVVDVLNQIKRTRPWVDLLKPEDGNLAMLLLAIDPSMGAYLTRAPEIMAKLARGAFARRVLGDEADLAQPAAASKPDPAREHDVIAEAIRQVDANVRPTERVATASLSWIDAVFHRHEGRAELSRVRAELEAWQNAKRDSFALTATSSADAAFLEDVSDDVDIVVAGHTHVARAQPRITPSRTRDGHAWYFNSGTWIALVDLAPALLADDRAFAPVWEALYGEDKTPKALLDANSPAIRRAATAVRIALDGDEVRGELLNFPTTGDAPVASVVGACTFTARSEG
jgi:UDP-2,3-diacylglucosamine pyrophosphatase LpxH